MIKKMFYGVFLKKYGKSREESVIHHNYLFFFFLQLTQLLCFNIFALRFILLIITKFRVDFIFN